MSLDYDLSKCPNEWDWYWSDEQREVTRAIIFSTMWVGIGDITEKNLEEFVERFNMWDLSLGYGSATFQEVNKRTGEKKNKWMTVDMLRPYVGLHTNVYPTESRAKFNGKLINNLRDRAKRL